MRTANGLVRAGRGVALGSGSPGSCAPHCALRGAAMLASVFRRRLCPNPPAPQNVSVRPRLLIVQLPQVRAVYTQ